MTITTTTTTLSLHFNGHFPGEPGLAGYTEAKDDVEVVVTTAAISRAKLQSNRHHKQSNAQLSIGRMPFLSPNQQCQSTGWKIAHSTDLRAPSSSGVFDHQRLLNYDY